MYSNKPFLELTIEAHIEKVWGKYKNDVFTHSDIITEDTLGEITKKDFIAGIESNYVKELIKKQSIRFYQWMKKNDIPKNAERFCNFSDQDMYLEFLNEDK